MNAKPPSGWSAIKMTEGPPQATADVLRGFLLTMRRDLEQCTRRRDAEAIRRGIADTERKIQRLEDPGRPLNH
jgi:hypothetical protein